MTLKDDPDLLKKVMTSDESWVYGYDIETNALSSNGSIQKRQDRKKHVKFDPMLRLLFTVYFDCNGMVHHEFLP